MAQLVYISLDFVVSLGGEVGVCVLRTRKRSTEIPTEIPTLESR